MLNVVKYILAVLFLIAGGVLAGYKHFIGGGLQVIDIISSCLLAASGAGYILYPLFFKMIDLVKNFKLPAGKPKVVPLKVSTLAEDRIAIDHLMNLGVEKDDKLIMDSMVKINDEVFKLHHQGIGK